MTSNEEFFFDICTVRHFLIVLNVRPFQCTLYFDCNQSRRISRTACIVICHYVFFIKVRLPGSTIQWKSVFNSGVIFSTRLDFTSLVIVLSSLIELCSFFPTQIASILKDHEKEMNNFVPMDSWKERKPRVDDPDSRQTGMLFFIQVLLELRLLWSK